MPLGLSSSALFVSKFSEAASGGVPPDTIAALNPADGTQVWSTTLASGTVKGATLDGATLYMEAVTAAPDPSVHGVSPINLLALDAATGKILWQVGVQDAVVGGDPVVSNGILYLSEEPGGVVAGTPLMGVVEAFKTSDGSSLWKHSVAGGAVVHAATSTEVVAHTVPHPGSQTINTTITALAASDGAQLWSIPLAGAFPAFRVVVSVGNLYIPILYQASGAGAVMDVGAADGKQVWSHAIAEGGPLSLQLSGSALFFVTLPGGSAGQSGPPHTMIEALSTTDGSLLWKQDVGLEVVDTLVVGSAAAGQ